MSRPSTNVAIRALLIVAVSALLLVPVACSKPTNESVAVNPVKRELIYDYPNNDYRFIIKGGGWQIDEEFTASYEEVHCYTKDPWIDNHARMVFKVVDDDRYSKTPTDQERLLVLQAMVAMSNQYGTNTQVIYPPVKDMSAGLVNVGTLKAVKYVWADRENQRMNVGPMTVRHNTLIFGDKKAYNFSWTTTVEGYETFFKNVFDDSVQTFRLRLYQPGTDVETREEMEHRTQNQ